VAQPKVYWGAPGIARYKGWFEEEFDKEGVRIEYVGFKGGAPMVGQALANGQIDLAGQGDLLSIIGRSSGMQTRLVLPFTKLSNAYLVVRKDSGIRSVADLRGKKVAYFKGNQIHLQVLRILALNGMAEKDIRSISLDPATAGSTLAGGDIDAIFSSAEVLTLRQKGIADVVYSTKGQPQLSSYNGLVATDSFVQKYPETLTRLIKVYVKADQWTGDPANRKEVVRIWAMGPLPNLYAEEDYDDRPWSERFSPLFDPLLVQHYKRTQDQIAEQGLLRGPRVDIDQWIDARFLNVALKELGLEKYWAPLGLDGKPLT
jgi:sulfonate transport system substrate-binding protein